MYPYNQSDTYYGVPQVSPWGYGWPIPPAVAPEPVSSIYPTVECPRISQPAAESCKKDAVCQTDNEGETYENPGHRFVPPSEFARSICTVAPVKSPRNRNTPRSGGPIPNYGYLCPTLTPGCQNISSFSNQNEELPATSFTLSTSPLSLTRLTDQDIQRAKVISKWALINMKETGECCVASFANAHQQLMFSNSISSVHLSGSIVDDGSGLYRLSGGLYWKAYRLMFPNFHEKYLPPKLSSAFSNGLPRRRWRRWTRKLYQFLAQFLDSSEDDTSDSENTHFPSVQPRTCDMDESVIGNLVQRAADRVFSRPVHTTPLRATENTPSSRVQLRSCDLNDGVIDQHAQKVDRRYSRTARPTPPHRTPMLETSPALSATPVMALAKTAKQQKRNAADRETREEEDFFVPSISEKASASSSSSASDQASLSDEERYHHRTSQRRKHGRPRPTTESKSSRFKTPVSAAPVTALPKTATRQQPASTGETRGRNVPVNAVSEMASVSPSSASDRASDSYERRRKRTRPRPTTESKSSRCKTPAENARRKGTTTASRSVDMDRRQRVKTRTIAKTSSASSARGQRKPTRRVGTFSAHSEGSANQDPKFLLFKGNGEVVDVRKLPTTRSGRLSIPVLEVGHRQNIIRSSAGLRVKHGEPDKFFSSFVDD